MQVFQLSVFGESEKGRLIQLQLSWKDRIFSAGGTVAVATGVADDQPLSPGIGILIYKSGVEHLSDSIQLILTFLHEVSEKSRSLTTSIAF